MSEFASWAHMRRHMRWGVIACALGTLMLAGCGDDATSADAGLDARPPDASVEDATVTDAGPGLDASDPEDASSPDDAGVDAPPLGCEGRTRGAGLERYTIEVDGRDRTFSVYAPEGYDATSATPVVFDFHGFTSNGDQQQALARMNAQADESGFLAVHPDGTGSPRGWNGGDCCGSAASGDVDDVGFVDTMLEVLRDDYCVDARRVFATGMSNGGFFSHRLACERADVFAAIAPVAGQLGIDDCVSSRPMPVMHFHGTHDTVVPYDGGGTSGFRSAAESTSTWRANGACDEASTISYAMGDTTCEQWACAGGVHVVLCTIDEGGHTWPGGVPIPFAGKTSTDISATAEMWRFFEEHPLP